MVCRIIFRTVFLQICMRLSNGQQIQGRCGPSNRTTFLRSQGFELPSGSQVILLGLSLMKCSRTCMDNIDDRNQAFNCNSFQFKTSEQTCILSSDSAQPFGTGELMPAANSDLSFFQKLCLPSQQLCDAPFSFDRIPQHVLVGYALEVFKSTSLSDCLRSCLESIRTFRIECKSAMYYYETQECILNREDKRNRPDLFSGDTQGFIVDYFDNNCSGTQCFAPEVLQYAKIENRELKNHKDVSLLNIDLDVCKHFCDVNQNGRGDLFPCKSYMYNGDSSTCYLSAENSLPRGRAELLENHTMDYYEKLCLSAAETCGGVTAFDRVETRVLVGFAREVIEMPSLIECLDACISALNKKNFDCKSVMYYYNTTECLLNTESRTTQPELFSEDTQGYIVDYFENNCFNHPGLCSNNQDRIYLKVENHELPGFDTSGLVSGLNPKDCVVRCTDETQFVCRSVDFRYNQCAWSYQDSTMITLSDEPPQPTAFYEARCVDDASICGNYFYAFEYKTNREFTGYVISKVTGISSSSCLSICLGQVHLGRCLSVNYDTLTSTCEINAENCRSKGAEPLRLRTGVDYYENQCSSVPLECSFEEIHQNVRPKSIYRLETKQSSSEMECQTFCEQALSFPCRSATYEPRSGACDLSDYDSRKPPDGDDLFETSMGFQYFEKGLCTGSMISIDCRFDGTRITISFAKPETGSIFVKNRYDACKSVFTSTTKAVLNIPFPGALSSTGPGQGLDGVKECQGSEIASNVYSYTIVVQTDSFGIPGLISSSDQLFNATCDYTQQITRITEAFTQATVDGVPDTQKDLQGKTSSVEQIITMHILRDGNPVSQALLGEECQLFWRIEEHAPKGFGFFVRECQAERLGGNPPDPEPLQLISDGCPDPNVEQKIITEPVAKIVNGFLSKMRMFRFDGSRSVKLRCVIDMCAGDCEEADCDLDSNSVESWGRKKRQAWTYDPANNDLKTYQDFGKNFSQYGERRMDFKGYGGIIKKGTISGVFTIVDKLPYGQNKDGFSGGIEQKSVLYAKGKICLIRPLFISLFTFLGLFCFAEGTFVFVYWWQNYHKRGDSVFPVSDSGWESSTQATIGNFKGPATAANTVTSASGVSRGRNVQRGNLGAFSDWHAYADHKLHAVSEVLRQRAQLWRNGRAPPGGDMKNRTVICEESSSDVYPSDGNSTTDSRKRLTKTRKSRRPQPNVLIALPAPVYSNTSSDCGSYSNQQKIVRVETYTREIMRKPAPPNPNQEIIQAPQHNPHPLYENSRFPPPLPPKRKDSLHGGQRGAVSTNPAGQERAPPLPPRSPSACSSAKSRSTLDGGKMVSPSGSVSDRSTPMPGRDTPIGSVASGHSQDCRRVRFEEWPPPPPTMAVQKGYRSHEFRDDDMMQSLAQEICERAIYDQSLS